MGRFIQQGIVAISILNSDNSVTINPLKGITTAQYIFDEIELTIVKPKPRIINRQR
jgi:hypothetical protein